MSKPRDQPVYTLGQLCKQVGLARSSVLNYESLGLLGARARSAAGYRLYGVDELEQLHKIRRLRDAGLSLADVRYLLTARGPTSSHRARGRRPVELFEGRLLALCEEAERIRRQQRFLARLLVLPGGTFTVATTSREFHP